MTGTFENRVVVGECVYSSMYYNSFMLLNVLLFAIALYVISLLSS